MFSVVEMSFKEKAENTMAIGGIKIDGEYQLSNSYAWGGGYPKKSGFFSATAYAKPPRNMAPRLVNQNVSISQH